VPVIYYVLYISNRSGMDHTVLLQIPCLPFLR